MFNFSLTTPISLFISLAALAGVTLHDTKIDKLATNFAGIPAIMTSTDPSTRAIAGEQHTHVERINLSDVSSSQPRIMPRGDHRKHLMAKNVPRGGHYFDGYSLPLA